jgi:hypothetical protein
VASELLRRLNFKTDRASVRRWALENQLVPDTRYKPTGKPVKRWQTRDYGDLCNMTPTRMPGCPEEAQTNKSCWTSSTTPRASTRAKSS